MDKYIAKYDIIIGATDNKPDIKAGQSYRIRQIHQIDDNVTMIWLEKEYRKSDYAWINLDLFQFAFESMK